MTTTLFRSGVAAIVGPPNAGKSTLLNTLLQQKIAIVSPKPQTTRNRITGIVNGPEYQIILLDTPGLHAVDKEMNRQMLRTALETLSESDVVLFLVDGTEKAEEDGEVMAQYKDYFAMFSCPAVLAINKVDRLPKERLLPLLDHYSKLHPFAAMVPISALRGEGIPNLLNELVRYLPEGPQYYPEDMPTDASERFIAGEIIRESVFLNVREEVPYSVAVVIDRFNEETRPVHIQATILVERSSQKGILIGKGGSMLTRIRQRATTEISKTLDRPVRIELWVKVSKNWTEKKDLLKELGLA